MTRFSWNAPILPRSWIAPLRFALLGGSLAACSPIVGAECRDGLTLCNDQCVDLTNDRRNCGSCGRSCVGSCFESMCIAPGTDVGVRDGGNLDGAPARDVGPMSDGGDTGVSLDTGPGFDGGDTGISPDTGATDVDGGTVDADLDASGMDASIDATVGDTGSSDAGPPDAFAPDAFVLSCGIGEAECGGMCIDVQSDDANCGGCGIACDATEVCASGMCRSTCTTPFGTCSGRCVNLSNDPDHCGNCTTVCSSGVCVNGTCSSALVGHVVVIGHDYESSRAGQSRIVGNAVFLGRGSPVDVLTWRGTATSASIAGTNAAIQTVAADIGRNANYIAATDVNAVTAQLANVDVFLVYAQAASTDTELMILGDKWRTALNAFVLRGGVVIVLDGGAATNSGTPHVLAAADLFAFTSRAVITGNTVTLVALGDALAPRVPVQYMGESHSVRFATTTPTTVVSDGTGAVVVHRTFSP